MKTKYAQSVRICPQAVILVLLCNSIRTKISAITEIISNACQLKTEFFTSISSLLLSTEPGFSKISAVSIGI
nr:hypothetical protein [Mycoplasmopsis bovis]